MEQVLQYFDSARYLFGILLAEWIFIQGAAPARKYLVRRMALGGLVFAVLTVCNTLLVPALAAAELGMPVIYAVLLLWNYLIMLTTILAIRFCYRISIVDAMSRALLGIFVERVLTVLLRDILFGRCFPDFPDIHPWLYMAVVLGCYALTYSLCRRCVAGRFHGSFAERGSRNTFSLWIFIAIYFLLSATSDGASVVIQWALPALRTLAGSKAYLNLIWGFCIVMMLAMALLTFLFQCNLYSIRSLREETLLLNHMVEEKARQYAVSAENIALINRRCHELKLQLATLNSINELQREKLLESAQKEIMIYDAVVKTGNEVLDTILTEKSLFCTKHKIRLSCTVHADALGKIETTDLYVMLGNALDNAIEHVRYFEDAEKRIVSLTIKQQVNLLFITVDNYYDGAPLAAQPGEKLRGMELKSIRMVAQKYGGDIRVSAEQATFTLTISLFTAS